MPRYIPPLSLLISVNDLPSSLGFVENSLNSIFSKLYFKDFYSEGSIHTHEVNYNITIVSFERLGLNIGGEEGFSLILNPSFVEGNTSEFPMSILYNWPLLNYIRSFDIETFDFSIEAIYNLLLDIGNIDEAQLLSTLVNVFYPDFAEDESEDTFQKFIDDFNTNNNPATPLTYNILSSEKEIIEDLITQLSSNGNEYSVFDIALNDYLSSDDDFGSVQKKLERLFYDVFGNFKIDNFQNFLVPNFSASLNSLFLALEFPRTWLKPINPSTLEVIEDEAVKSRLTYNAGSLSYHSEKGFEFGQLDSFDLTPSQIGNTGLSIDINNLKFDFRTDKNIPEADADGRPTNFQGVYADLVSIGLPKAWFSNTDVFSLQIVGRNLLIGTGGISGTISLETVADNNPNNGNDYLTTEIGGWGIGFNYFDLTFKQNVITYSRLEARLEIPGLAKQSGGDDYLYMSGDLNTEGDFNLTFSKPDGIEFTLFNFVTFNITSAKLGRLDNDFYIGASCEIWFQNGIMDKILGGRKIVVPEINFYDNGRMEIVGGTTSIPVNVSLNLGPVEVAVTGIHFGSHQENDRKYNYWGFDGAISLDPLGIDARGEGIKYYYTVDNDEHGGNGDSFLRIQTIEVDMVIPGSASPESAMAIIHGMLSIPQPGDSPEYIGEMTLKLPQPKITASASMRLMPKYPAFAVDAAVSFPAPIPLGPVGIYGFRGLLGYRYVAEKEAVGLTSGQDSWYDYYKYPPQGIHLSKFSNPEETEGYQNPIAVGAGAVAGTLFDGGETLSVRAMLLLSLPSVFMIDGRANILSKRLDIVGSPEPPFFAGMAWGDNSIEMWIGADYQIGSNGWILDLYAEVQAGFFFNNPSNWYVNFGTKQKPMTAKALTLFESQSYLMLSAKGISTGARADFKLEKRFGPAKVKVSAYVEIGGDISFERSQIGGYVAAGGEIKVDIWIVKLTIGLDALLSVEAAKPFLIYAELKIRACVKIVFAKVCKSFTVKLKWELNSYVDRTPIPPLPYQSSGNQKNRTKELVKGVHMLTNETFDVQFLDVKTNNATWQPNASSINEIIPLDTYIDIKTIKGLIPNIPSSKIGGYTSGANNYTDIIPPEKVVRGGMELRQVKHKYSIEEIELKAYDGSNWVDYEPFKAVVKEADRSGLPSLIGYWQKSGKQYDTIRILASNPFTYTESGEPGWFIPEQYGITPSSLFCEGIQQELTCLDFLNKPLGSTYYPPSQYIGHFINGAYFTLDGIYYINEEPTNQFEIAQVDNPHGKQQSLKFSNEDDLVIILPNPVAEVHLKLTTDAQGVRIDFYSSLVTDNILPNHQLVNQVYKTKTELSQEVTYVNSTNPIIKIIIRPDETDTDTIDNLQLQIAELYDVSYQEAKGEVGGSVPKDMERYNYLLEQINSLQSVGCKTEKNNDKECRPDEKLCNDLYDRLLYLFENCFPIPLNSFQQLDTKCFDEFLGLLEQYSKSIYENIKEEWNTYLFLLEKIKQWKSDRDIDMDIYLHFRNTAYTIIDIVKEVGDCDCKDSCDINERVCFYKNQFTVFYIYYFNISNPEQIRDNLPFFNYLLNIMERDILNSSYPFDKEFITEFYPLFEAFYSLNIKLRKESNWELYLEFKSLFENIISFFNVQGNCNCDEGGSVKLNCSTSLQELCWLTLEDYEYNQTIPGQGDIDQQYEDMVAAVQNTAQPIWRPNTKYYMRFRLKDIVDNGENERNFDYYYAFKTVGPLGHYHKHPEVAELPKEHPLASLTNYIDYDKSYPDAKGNLLKAKPVFYGNEECKISLYFIKPMVYHMLKSWDSYDSLDSLMGKMHIIIKDPVNNTVIPYPLPVEEYEDSIPLTDSEDWNQDENPITLLHLQQLNNMIDFVSNNANEITCTPKLGESLVPNVPVYETVLTNLKPNKLYTALVYNAFDKNGNDELSLDESELIHEYVFRTSRYLNFEEQVNSYQLQSQEKDGTINYAQAVYSIEKSFSTSEINEAYQAISNPNYSGDEQLALQFYHLFDRVFEGILGFTPWDPPTTTEFNKIIDKNTNKVIALLIRNPEPFNIPKIPEDIISDTLKVMENQSSEASGYHYLYAKDYSQVLVMNNSKSIIDISLNFMFKYKVWLGNTYSNQSQVYVENIIINPEN
ncbi:MULTISPECIES: hypothetical protein [Mesonia]|uniref:Uncharacterized protein n=1 Tax=Mesonia oceanica TaxID=2687242 RepID=A0AC61Y5S0_9FLAO|nr:MULTISPECIES: hypothetical protein [Mesonia]MAN28803.1 hypothetical protein [Mesonia sp.]MAQ41865.1 hypothetical protein [Mesonia sp.]MBJ99012.1 hypothetical protein [Flavobacteriaceae bacterium]VVU99212.1 hypothetical protein FVB9532_00464 [Mesonia oceanica]|tara:strand:+ start:51450 stop:57821 length:6372 start_codon:yes stop_codon:yes gene_type:complete